jgi:hypothetical protein
MGLAPATIAIACCKMLAVVTHVGLCIQVARRDDKDAILNTYLLANTSTWLACQHASMPVYVASS